MFHRLTGHVHQKVDMLKRVLSLLLHSLCQIEVLVTRNEVVDTKITDTLGGCEVALQNWIKNVIGGSYFGKTFSNGFLYGSVEFKVCIIKLFAVHNTNIFQLWQNVLSLEIPKLQSIANAWSVCIERVIRQRVDKVWL